MTAIARTAVSFAGWRAFGLLMSLYAVLVTASSAYAANQVSYRDGKLWLAVEETPAEAVFAVVAKRTGMTIVAPAGLTEKRLSITAAGVSVEAAIARILRAAGYSNYVLVYEADGRAGRLVVLDGDRQPSRSGTSVYPQGGEATRVVPAAISPAPRSLAERVLEDGKARPPAADPRAARSPSPMPPQAPQAIRQQIAAWKTLNAAERHEVHQYIKRLPFAERAELTVYLRHHVFGRPLHD